MKMWKKKRIISCVLALCFVFILFYYILPQSVKAIFLILAFAAFAADIIMWFTIWRCPYCGKFLGRLDSAKYCRHCGKEIENS